MIAVDTSALMAIVLDEAEASACVAALESDDQLLISAATAAEAFIVASRRNVEAEMNSIIDGLGMEAEPVTLEFARRVAEAYRRWGMGAHRPR